MPDSATTTAVVNQKGGVGKTTTAFNVGALLAARRRVLLVDLDAQSTLSVACGFPLGATDGLPTSYELMTDRGFDPVKAIVPTEAGPDLIPAKLALATAELSVAAMMQREFVLKEQLAKIADRYDHILIDCSPSLGLLTVNALTAANKVIVPVQCEYLSMRGLVQLQNTLQMIRENLNPGVEIEGILPTMLDSRTVHAKEAVEILEENFGELVFKSRIRKAIKFAEAPVRGTSVLKYDPGSKAASAYRDLAKEVLTHGS